MPKEFRSSHLNTNTQNETHCETMPPIDKKYEGLSKKVVREIKGLMNEVNNIYIKN